MIAKSKAKVRQSNPPRGISICAKCNRENSRPAQRYCLDCHNAYMREWRKTHRLSGEGRKRDGARSYAGQYKKRGNLAQEPCLVCGDQNSEMHHPDHEMPLMVVWLCRKCHLAWHSFWRQVVAEAWTFWNEQAARTPEFVTKNDALVSPETNDAFRKAS